MSLSRWQVAVHVLINFGHTRIFWPVLLKVDVVGHICVATKFDLN